MYAAAALERLADPGEDGIFGSDPVTSAYRKLLNAERNKDIRKCILGVMPVVRGSTLQVDSTVCTGLEIASIQSSCRGLIVWSGDVFSWQTFWHPDQRPVVLEWGVRSAYWRLTCLLKGSVAIWCSTSFQRRWICTNHFFSSPKSFHRRKDFTCVAGGPQ